MNPKTRIASAMRKVGLGRVVENKILRSTVGAPIYRRMLSGHDMKGAVTNPAYGGRTAKSGGQAAFLKHAIKNPQLAVIVPAYNVSAYIDQCLRSILEQSFTSMEILVIDDGSTDDTLAKAQQVAAGDLRVTVISKINAGLGAARNTGLEMTDAPFVTFVDSDDVIMPGAYESMMASLDASGSGMAIGSIERFDEVRSWTPTWVPMVHGEDRRGVTGNDFPTMMWDVFAWNKIYKRSVWDEVAGRFPEGTLYEDQECTARIFISATPIDVLEKVVYRWRLRHDNSSITQQKTDPGDLRQRIAVMNNVETLIAASSEEYQSVWRAKTLGEDFYYYLREAPRGGSEFWDVLRGAVGALWQRCSEKDFRQIPVDRRWIAYAGANSMDRELEDLLVHFEQNPGKYVVRENGGRFVAESPVLLPGFPEELNEVSFDELDPQVMLRQSSASGDGSLTFEGFAFVDNLHSNLTVDASLVVNGSERDEVKTSRFPIQVFANNLDEADIVSRHPFIDFADSARRFVVEPAVIDEVARLSDHTQSPELVLEVLLTSNNGAIWETQKVKRTLELSAGAPDPTHLTSQRNRAAVVGSCSGPLKVVVLSPRFVASTAEVTEGRELRIEVHLANTGGPSIVQRYLTEDLYLEVEMDGLSIVRAPLEQIGDATWRARSLLPDHIGRQKTPFKTVPLQIVSSQGLRSAIACEAGNWTREATAANGLSTTPYGFLEFYRAAAYATAREYEVSEHGDRVTFRGTYFADAQDVRTQSPTFALVGSVDNIYPIAMTHDAATCDFEVSFPLVTKDARGKSVAIPSGRYIFQVLLPTNTDLPASAWVTSGIDFEAGFPSRIESKFVSLRFAASARARSVIMTVAAPLWRELETRRYQQEMGNTFISSRRTGLREAVLFESFGGASVSDSPRAIDRHLAADAPEIERFWTVANCSVSVPEGATPVLLHSREWYELASSAKLLVNNNNFVSTFRKAEGQKYVQTWHGTPLKKIGLDVPSRNLSLRYRQLIRREASEYWDLLLAQSQWAAEVLRGAFAYEGPISAEGYPRNDVLSQGDGSDERRRLIREHLGLGDRQKVVLYAPTWRDNLKDPSGHYSRIDFLDLRRAVSKLGPEYTVLFRSHANGAAAKAIRTPPGAIDVTLYPNINDLILASDLLVTDYSSIMFDYVVTGRPVVFLAPDLDLYAGETRGFYFDFANRAPGPIARTGDEAIVAIRHELSDSSQRSAAYWKFLATFAPSEDGLAGKRVMKQILDLIS